VERSSGPNHPNVAPCLNNLLAVYLARGRYSEAVPLYRRALAMKEKTLGANHPELASSLANYAALLRRTNSDAEAAAVEKRATTLIGSRVTSVWRGSSPSARARS
jgi:hypothetical protein